MSDKINEKLKRLGFKVEPGTESTHVEKCLDMLFDFQMWTEGAGTGQPTGDELNICAQIYWRITHGGEHGV